LYFLRAVQLGLHIDDMEVLSMGDVMDVITESSNDGTEYKQVATQADFDRF
jgi:hypothetical protein